MKNTLNIFAQKDTVYFGVKNDSGQLTFKKNIDFNIFEGAFNIGTEIIEELDRNGIKNQFESIHFIENSEFPVAEMSDLNKSFNNLKVIDIKTSLFKSIKSLENQSDQKTLILHLDNFISLGAFEEKSIRPIDTKALMHYNVDELGRECKCGKLGCLLRYASPDGLIQTAQEKVEFYSGPTQLSLETPGELKFKKLVTYTKKGDPLAIELLNQTIALLLPAFRETVKNEKTERVIISGRMGQFGKLISKPLQATLSEMNGKTTPVLTPFSKSYEEVFIGLDY